jgi:hypothetical protein
MAIVTNRGAAVKQLPRKRGDGGQTLKKAGLFGNCVPGPVGSLTPAFQQMTLTIANDQSNK